MLHDHFDTRDTGTWREMNLHSWLPWDAFKNLFIIGNEGSVAGADRFNANSYLPLVDMNMLLKPQLKTSWISCFLSPFLDKTTNPGVVIDTQTCWISCALHKLSLCQPDQGTSDWQEKKLSKRTYTSFSLPYYLLSFFVLS